MNSTGARITKTELNPSKNNLSLLLKSLLLFDSECEAPNHIGNKKAEPQFSKKKLLRLRKNITNKVGVKKNLSTQKEKKKKGIS
jgi:hypothetical protein